MPIEVLRSNTAFVLVGGQGTRLKALFPDTPKPLVPLGGEVFLDRLLSRLIDVGIKNIFLLAGYMPASFSHYHLKKIKDSTIHLIVEDKPLGSAGAVALGYKYLKETLGAGRPISIEDILIVNGDTWYGGDIGELLNAHYQADYYLGVCNFDEADRYGLVETDSEQNVLSFHEKKENSSGWVNSGYMVVSDKVLSSLSPENFASLEKDIYPSFRGRVSYLKGHFYDYGTPESYREINKMFWMESARKQGAEVEKIARGYILDPRSGNQDFNEVSLNSEQAQFVERMKLDPYLRDE